MTAQQVSVLVSQYADDLFTAWVIDGPQVSAGGSTAAEAFAAVRQRIRKLEKTELDEPWPDAHAMTLERTTVSVRLFQHDRNRRTPVGGEIRLPVRYAVKQFADNSIECFLVDFDSEFYCSSTTEMKRLIDEHVRGYASQVSAHTIAALTPPLRDEIRPIRVRPRERRSGAAIELPSELSAVATPVLNQRRGPGSRDPLVVYNGPCEATTKLSGGSVLLVGPTGCGKSTVVSRVAWELQDELANAAQANDDFDPESDSTPRAKRKFPPVLWQTSAENLIAGMAYLGQWEERVERIIADADSISAILAFESLIDFVRLGGQGPTDSLAAFLIPYLRRGELSVIAEATEDEVEAIRRLLPELLGCFEIVRLEAVSDHRTRAILTTMFGQAERDHRLTIDRDASFLIAQLMKRFCPAQAPPKPAIDLSRRLIQSAISDKRSTISRADIIDAVTQRTGVPEMVLRDDRPLSVDEVRRELSESVIDQSAAVDVAAGVVIRVKAGLCDPDRPIATLMFSGPTGVGKTQLAQCLAKYLFGSKSQRSSSDLGRPLGDQPIDDRLIRLDMSEYGGYDGVHRLTVNDDGDVAGWIGRVRNQPLNVLLLDEFEKASPEVHDVWLSAFDEGRITDRFGRVTSLCGTIIVLTTNVGASRTSAVGFSGLDPQQGVSRIDKAIRNAFRPEFLNRLDEIVSFNPINPETARRIVIKELESLRRRETIVNQRLHLEWTTACVDQLVETGFDAKHGARPLQRAIEQSIVPQIARAILARSPDNQPWTLELNEQES
ncbi:AAA family ATPase [Neorhodopirellula pilleata]|uniref:Chaperone protein ClpB 1 n=1 Tax=Neorhodopirellula pilleata TaxID=2714738 RepID=A0A5C6AVV0_9BACT|nr:AAA family ATPase [Neorhodopirellula pilleata]TWU03617.1 Chaperone protein ClpB 1 [Neorhodopirellula pilleata]